MERIPANDADEFAILHPMTGLCLHVDTQSQALTMARSCDSLFIWTTTDFPGRILHIESGKCLSVPSTAVNTIVGLDMTSCFQQTSAMSLSLHQAGHKITHVSSSMNICPKDDSTSLIISTACLLDKAEFILQQVPAFELLSAPTDWLVKPAYRAAYEYSVTIPAGIGISEVVVNATCMNCTQSTMDWDRNDLTVSGMEMICANPQTECNNFKSVEQTRYVPRYTEDSMTSFCGVSYLIQKNDAATEVGSQFRHRATFTVTRPKFRKDGDIIHPWLSVQLADDYVWVMNAALKLTLNDVSMPKLVINVNDLTQSEYAGSRSGVWMRLDNQGPADITRVTATLLLPQFLLLENYPHWKSHVSLAGSRFANTMVNSNRRTITMQISYIDPSQIVSLYFLWISSYQVLKGVSKETTIPVHVLVTYCLSEPCGSVSVFTSTYTLKLKPLPDREVPRANFRLQNQISRRCLALGAGNQVYVTSDCGAVFKRSDVDTLIDLSSGMTLPQPGSAAIAEYTIDFERNFHDRVLGMVICMYENFETGKLVMGKIDELYIFAQQRGCNRTLFKGRYLQAWKGGQPNQTRGVGLFDTIALGRMWVICNLRGNLGDRTNCYVSWKNLSWTGLDSSITSVMFYHPSPEALYGTRNRSKQYFKIELVTFPLVQYVTMTEFSTKSDEIGVQNTNWPSNLPYPVAQTNPRGYSVSSAAVRLSNGGTFLWAE